MKNCLLLFTILTFAGLLLGACTLPSGSSFPTATQAPTETIGFSPTASKTPTDTPQPTKTPIPSFTPTSTPLAITWSEIGLPTGAAHTHAILVHPQDNNLWYVIGTLTGSSSESAIYITSDAGQTWQTVYTGKLISTIILDPQNANTLYSTEYGRLLRSTDRGQTWEILHDFTDIISSLHISTITGAIYVLPSWYSSTNPGIYRSDDGGQTWNFFSYGAEMMNFIPWDMEEDPNTGTLYVVIEIANHPQPYDPPFYRSTDRGETWEEIGDDLPWHGFTIQVDPLTSHVYYLSEGAGLYKSIDMGTHWTRISPQLYFASRLLVDPGSPPRLFGSDILNLPLYEGGVYYSDDGGESFTFQGLKGHYITDLTLNANSTKLYVVSRDQGIYTAEIPAPRQP